MATAIPIKIYEILEDKLGRDEAKELVREIEAAVNAITGEAKIEVKDTIGKELITRGEFSSEIKSLREHFDERISHLETKLESKMRLYFLILLFAMFILNPRAIDLIAKFLGVIR
jgi:hypothetical protein